MVRLNKTSEVIFLLAIVMIVSSFAISCSKSDAIAETENVNSNQAFVTQERLDAATMVSAPTDTLIIGNPFNDREPEARNNFRDIFSNFPKSGVIRPGNIITIRNYTNENGTRGQLLFIDVMVKREAGFNPTGNDFEYMRIPFNAATDYKAHPNGLLPDVSQTVLRGLNILPSNCVQCHSRNQDFVFFN